MKATILFAPTLREVPSDAEVISHQLLLRAGFIRRAAAGIYSYLPLALRVIKNIERIVREEMDRQGGQELLMPIIQPGEIWQESGRWNVYGPELFRLKDRHNRDFALGPTHEEIITILVRGDVKSYKQFPLLLYQIQNKYRDERRPRFGMMRAREFIMKDLYSFDKDNESLEISYLKMQQAYKRVFERIGLRFKQVEADSGAIGGAGTHEFMVLANSGEATVLYCSEDKCGYAANAEKAVSALKMETVQEEKKPLTMENTPGRQSVKDVANFLGVDSAKVIKTLIYIADGELVAALVKGNREVNDIKLQNELDCLNLEMANASKIKEITGATAGFTGPIGLKGIKKIIADEEVASVVNAVSGANEEDMHYINVNPSRDFNYYVADIRLVREGDPCFHCGSSLQETRGIEVGQVFKLGDKYSKILGANYLDEGGRSRPIIMGCYGIGITRTMAAAIEQNHDQDGIIWPPSIAPFQVVVIPVNYKDDSQMNMAIDIYKRLMETGLDVVLDERSERAGVKFKDSDLIGFPLRVTVGTKAVLDKQVEIKVRKSSEVLLVPFDNIEDSVKLLLDRLLIQQSEP